MTGWMLMKPQMTKRKNARDGSKRTQGFTLRLAGLGVIKSSASLGISRAIC